VNIRDVSREFLQVPLGLVDAPVLPSRTEMDEQRMDELTASVREHGILQPLVFARKGERFEVVAGHRRSIAAGRAGLVAVPAIVYPAMDVALEAIKFAENRHREELNPADEAIYLAELLERDCGGDVDRLCAQLGEKRTYVENRLLLFSGDPRVFERLQQGKITIGVAQQLNRCTDDTYRRFLLHQAIEGGATVAVVTGWIADWKRNLHPGINDVVAVSTSAPAPIADSTAYFTCRACGGTDNVPNMRPVNFHDYCIPATLTPALEQHARRGDVFRYPRTQDEATELIAELVDRFPGLTQA
jgi:ParB/RepB/Spo0J family partition protein